MLDETALLRRYVESADEEAFTELVRQQVDFVYSAALRQVGRDAHLAQDVTQGVFLALARSGPSLLRRPALAGWLYTTTRHLAAKAVRSHRRWQAREQEAQTMDETGTRTADDPNWEELRPVLDGAMHELGARDREAILLRYFENRPYADIARACGLNENAARMRVERALDRLRDRLVRRGVTSSAGALALALTTHSVGAAPACLAETAAQFSVTVAGAGVGIIEYMAMTKTKIAAIGAVMFAASMGSYFLGEHVGRSRPAPEPSEEIARLREENQRLLSIAAEHQREMTVLQAANARVASGETTPNEANQETLASLRALVAPLGEGLGFPGQATGEEATAMVTFFDRRGRITDGFAALFRLTDLERRTLQAVFDQVKRGLNDAASATAEVSRDGEGRIVIDIPPVSGGVALYDRLFGTFAETLGPERNAEFFRLAASQLEVMLHRFGGEKRRLVVSPGEVRTDGKRAYQVREEHEHATGSRRGGGTYLRDDLEEIFGSLAKFVPSDF